MEELLPFSTDGDEELVIFDMILNTKDRTYHYLDKIPGIFDLNKLTDDFCFTHFRFYKADIKQLLVGLNIPVEIKLKSRAKIKGCEALCVLFQRLAYPNRYADMMQFFPKGRSVLSETFNYMIEYIISEKGHLLTNIDQEWLSNRRIKQMCEEIQAKESPYNLCFRFVDGTVKAICRPTKEQREFYSGHKRIHSLKFQSLILPNGIIYNLFGSIGGRRHDAHLLAKSQLLQMLRTRFGRFADPPYIYGDLAYPLNKFLITPFKAALTDDQRKVNFKMSRLRISVEWGFAKILQLFPFIDFDKNL